MNSGWLGSSDSSSRMPSMLDLPRISMSGRRLGSEPKRLLSITLNDGSRLFRLRIGFCTPTVFSSCPEKVADEPVKVSLRLVTTPVTTTSSRFPASSCIMIFTLFMLPFPLTMAVCGFIPMKVKWSSLLEPSGTTMVNCPLMSVVMLILLLADVTSRPAEASFSRRLRCPQCASCQLQRFLFVLRHRSSRIR